MKLAAKKQSKNIVKGRNGGTLHPPSKGDPSPNPNGRPKGSLNRSTIVKKFLDAMSKAKNPITGEIENLTQEERMTLSMIYAATAKFDVRAYNSLLDNKYGKLKENVSIEAPIILEYVRPAKPPKN
jgi:hypothetical protein